MTDIYISPWEGPPPDQLPLVCSEVHGYACCGCFNHPAGKPWGWNGEAWEKHFATCPQAAASRADEGERRLVIRVNSGPKMSRGKYAAAAVHAALMLLGVHPGTPVIVLGGTRTDIEQMPIQVHDAGRTEVARGTLTAGAQWERDKLAEEDK